MNRRPTDILRGMYVHLPPTIRHALAPFFAFLPVGIKYGATYGKMREAILLSERDSEFVGEYRKTRIANLLTNCIEKSRYYQEALKSCDFTRDGIEPDDLHRMGIPVLDKEKVRDIATEL